MTSSPAILDLRRVPVLLRGEPAPIRSWMQRPEAGRLWLCLAVIVVGAGLFGAAMGSWRAPLQALYTAIKLPLIILLTALGNGLLNAMLAPLLGVNVGVRQSLLAVMISFTIAAVILGAFSPLLAYLVWNTPPRSVVPGASFSSHGVVLLSQTAMIAFAGIAANVRLLQLLRELSGSTGAARKVLFAWLAGNLLLGSQLSWIFRPFVGSPNLAVEFLRADPFHGSFYEAVFNALRHLLSP
jgi:hypothetical protein